MLKRTTLTLKRSGKIKKKPIAPELREARREQADLDRVFYEKIWASRSHQCEVHDGYKFLGYSMKKMFMDHLLEKSKYPHLRHVDKNIALVCGDCHACKSVGHPTAKHILLIERAKEELLS